MANVIQVEKKKDPILSNMGSILSTAGSIVGSVYGGPAGGMAGGAIGGQIGGALSGDANKPGPQNISAPQKRLAIKQLNQGLSAAEATGDVSSANQIQQALAMAENKNQSMVTDDTIARRLARQQQQGAM